MKIAVEVKIEAVFEDRAADVEVLVDGESYFFEIADVDDLEACVLDRLGFTDDEATVVVR